MVLERLLQQLSSNPCVQSICTTCGARLQEQAFLLLICKSIQIINRKDHQAVVARKRQGSIPSEQHFLVIHELKGLLVIPIREKDATYILVMLTTDVLDKELFIDGSAALETNLPLSSINVSLNNASRNCCYEKLI